MELHQLRYFVEVANHNSFTRAAAACYVSQPALSQQIKKLEASLRTKLISREGNRVELTDAGRVFYAHACRILTAVEEARRDVQNQGDQRPAAMCWVVFIQPEQPG